jgi:DNA relaxase NicK
MIENTWCVDWLSTTFKGSLEDIQVRDAVSFGFPKRAWTMGTPRYGYAFMMSHPFGHSIMSHPGRKEMGVHLSLTGRALRSLAEGGITALSMLEWAIREGGRVTRIDLAVDVFDEDIDIVALAGSPRDKSAPGSARKWSFIKGHDGGCTAYIGSRKSEKFMRIYDKAAEQGLKDRKWVRFELEIKGDAAKEVAAKFAVLPEGEHAAYIKGIMRALFNPTDATYQAIMNAPAVKVSTSKDTDDVTLEWLINSVAKTLAKTIERRSDVDVYELFRDAVLSNLQHIEHLP